MLADAGWVGWLVKRCMDAKFEDSATIQPVRCGCPCAATMFITRDAPQRSLVHGLVLTSSNVGVTSLGALETLVVGGGRGMQEFSHAC